MKTREIQCKFYICHGKCTKNKEADFYGICQHCGRYEKKEGVKPNRIDNRKKKMDKIKNKEIKKGEWY